MLENANTENVGASFIYTKWVTSDCWHMLSTSGGAILVDQSAVGATLPAWPVRPVFSARRVAFVEAKGHGVRHGDLSW